MIKLLAEKDMNISDLIRHTSKQAVHNHLPKLYEEGLIKSYLKGLGLVKKPNKHNYDMIFIRLIERFDIKDYERPQDVLKLIEDMSKDRSYEEKFIRLCMEKGGKEEFEKFLKENKNLIPAVPNFGVEPAKIESVRRLAIQLMSNLVPGLKEKVAFALTSDHIQYRLQLLNSFI